MSTTPGKARASSARTKATATRTKTQATAAEKSTPKVNRAVATASRSPGTAAAKSTPVTAKTAATKKKLNSNVKSALRGMTFTLGQGEISTSSSDCLVLLCPAVASVASALTQVDAASAGQLSQLIEREGFTAKPGQTLLLLGDYGLRATRILLLGIGDGSVSALRQSLNAVLSVLKPFPIRTLAISLVTSATLDSQTQARAIAECLSLIEHRADHLKSEPASVALQLQTVSLYGNAAEADAIRSGLATGRAIGQGMNLARFLGDLPGNLCTPSYLADQAKQLAASHKKLSVEVLEEKQMKTLGMGSLLSVAAGSDQPAKLIVLQYQGGSKKEAPIALVGKGITFDTGGISLKPGAGMDEMKYDMCGAASVLGTFKTLNELNLPINVVGVIAATENMPNGNATKPGDIVTSMAGLTIEILNTDAEGRLVLCDALTYCQTRFKPKAVVDIATLTGACVIALGAHASGLFSNDQSLSEALRSAGETSGDRAWPMPIWDEYQKQLDSNFADLANIGGREAGSVTAACFLSRFTKDVAWAHLDVAGTAWKSGAAKGATGRPVGLLVQYLLDQPQQ